MAVPAVRDESLEQARLNIRRGQFRGPTAGLAPGYVQGNLVILPRTYADDFRNFCLRNPTPCPLIGMSEPGDPTLAALGDLDIRTDLPRYRVWKSGVVVDEVTDIGSLWGPDLVTFVLGCSFTFEHVLAESGIPLRHIQERRNVAMYRTSMKTAPAGPFHGPLVVSMRPMKATDAIRAIQITTRYPLAHGAPVHLGAPELIGIDDLMAPDYGDAVDVAPDEIPVFWACGVTTQVAIEQAKPETCITHAPGCMLITGLPTTKIALL
jgi:uncharacterized protein YcsI (UPF0317 family)